MRDGKGEDVDVEEMVNTTSKKGRALWKDFLVGLLNKSKKAVEPGRPYPG